MEDRLKHVPEVGADALCDGPGDVSMTEGSLSTRGLFGIDSGRAAGVVVEGVILFTIVTGVCDLGMTDGVV